ncbi:MAG: hypothetical protein B7X08_04500 [Acidocella sp. 20-63-7]|nr:MAG: hypothetical protein B7X08_04500 [Acidocella sp. 20-63-7]HQT46190.1 hypothetical protein [Acidocella sp.]
MIVRGLFMLARGKAEGIKEFGASLDNFTASLAPLIAFPLVGAAILVMQGDWKFALISLLSRISSVLLLPLMVHEFARRLGHEALWTRAATALNWSFWMILPVLFVAAFLGALLAQFGVAMSRAEYFVLGFAGGYLLWYRWVIVKAGLALSGAQAAVFVALSSVLIGVLTVVPVLVMK